MSQPATITATPAVRRCTCKLIGVALILLGLALALPAVAFASGWNTQNSGASNLSAVTFANASDGWAVGNGILATTDGGATWNTQYSGPTNGNLMAVTFANASDGWAVGCGDHNGTLEPAVVSTTDGGATWSTELIGTTTGRLNGVAFVNVSDGWAVDGNNGDILATTDGGTTWSTQCPNASLYLSAVTFANASDGWAVGDDSNGCILATTDGGATWNTQYWGPTNLMAITFANASDGWAVGNGILATTDGGATWNKQLDGWGINGVTFTDATHGWAVGGSAILATSNGGVPSPESTIVAQPASALATQPVTFDASSTSSVPLWAADYRWDLDGSGTFATDTGITSTVSTTFDAPGTYNIGLRVTGTTGLISTSTLSYVVAPSTATVSGPTQLLTGQAAAFDASGSAVPGGTISNFGWDFDGSGGYGTDTGTTGTVSHTFSTPGTYQVEVRVTRPGGRVDRASTQVDVFPAPPAGNIGISINNGDYAVNTPKVTLDVVWAAFVGTALVSNDGGFGSAGSTTLLPLAAEIPWTLRTQGSELLPKTVYLRFPDSTNPLDTFTDDIVVDTTKPVVQSAQLLSPAGMSARLESARRAYRVRLKASQTISGVSTIQLSHTRSGGVKVRLRSRTVAGVLHLSRTISVKLASRPRYVRAQSAAGTWSKWRLIR